MTDHSFFLKSLMNKQQQTRLQGKAGKQFCCFVDFRNCFDLYLALCCGRCWRSMVSMAGCYN